MHNVIPLYTRDEITGLPIRANPEPEYWVCTPDGAIAVYPSQNRAVAHLYRLPEDQIAWIEKV